MMWIFLFNQTGSLLNRITQRAFIAAVATIFNSATVQAAVPEMQLEIRDHLFYPSTLEIPAGQKIRLMINNLDETAEEFESYELNREKVIPGKSRAVIFIGPLKPGEYPFFGEFYPKTAQGRVVAK